MWDAQLGRCSLCADPLDRSQAVIDHDHDHCPLNRSCRLCRRGLLCHACNVAVGLLRDDPDRVDLVAANFRPAHAAAKARIAAGPVQAELIPPAPPRIPCGVGWPR
jgi:hypothetical protein